MDLKEFRQIFYFFQYQFYLRSERAARIGLEQILGEPGLLPKGPIGQFLFHLAENPDEMHYRWEHIESTPRSVGRKQGSSGPSLRDHKKLQKLMKDPPGHFPVELSQGVGKPVIYRAKWKSIRCRYMLFEFPEKYRKDQIKSLYKSLVIHDLVNLGFKTWDIAKAMVDRNLSELVRFRDRTVWEKLKGPFFEASPKFHSNIFESESNVDGETSLEKLFLRNKLTIVHDNSKLASKKDSGYDQHSQIRVIHGEVLRYLRTAQSLTENIAKGQFHNFSSFI